MSPHGVISFRVKVRLERWVICQHLILFSNVGHYEYNIVSESGPIKGIFELQCGY